MTNKNFMLPLLTVIAVFAILASQVNFELILQELNSLILDVIRMLDRSLSV